MSAVLALPALFGGNLTEAEGVEAKGTAAHPVNSFKIERETHKLEKRLC